MRSLLKVDARSLKQELIDRATKVSDEALDKVYGYGLSTDTESFGYKANKLSATYALHEFFHGESIDIDSVEYIANAVHDGWSYAAYHIEDSRYLTQPYKKANRLILADTSYTDLPEEEKEKDRVIARSIINFLKQY